MSEPMHPMQSAQGKSWFLFLIAVFLLMGYTALLTLHEIHYDLPAIYRPMVLTLLLALYGAKTSGIGSKVLLFTLAGYSFFQFNSTMLWPLGFQHLYIDIPIEAHAATRFYLPQFIAPIVWIAGMVLLITRPKTGKAIKFSAAAVALIQFAFLLMWIVASSLINNISETLLKGLTLFYQALKYIDPIVLGLFFAALAFTGRTQQAATPAMPQPMEATDSPLVTAP